MILYVILYCVETLPLVYCSSNKVIALMNINYVTIIAFFSNTYHSLSWTCVTHLYKSLLESRCKWFSFLPNVYLLFIGRDIFSNWKNFCFVFLFMCFKTFWGKKCFLSNVLPEATLDNYPITLAIIMWVNYDECVWKSSEKLKHQ